MPSPATGEDAATDNASSRRMRKRELDRRCQRVARERTKNRIAYLEGLVDDFRKSDSSGQVATLMKQLSDTSKERDMLARTLQGIQNSIQTHQSLIKGETKEMVEKIESGSPTQSSDTFERLENEANADQHISFPPHRGETSASPKSPTNVKFPHKFESVQDDSLFLQQQQVPIAPSNGGSFQGDGAFIDDDLPENHGVLQDPIIPRTEEECECSSNSAMGGKQTVNMWRFANEVLTEPSATNTDLERFEDVMEEDAPVRALIEGWPAVERLCGGKLPPTWRKLRRIDEIIFGNCNVRERLAIMRVMHKLMRYHTNKERKSTVPAWYLKRPSQTIAHSYAIDYFAWPGLRERFVFYQHHYCSNLFWQLFCKSLRILWPFEFRDCYTRNLETGQYQISQQFDDRIGDINAWTMSNDIFKRWPEFYSDIPAYNHIPSSVAMSMRPMFPPSPRNGGVEVVVVDDRRDELRQDEVSPLQFLDPWSAGSQFAPLSAKGMDFMSTNPYLDYSGLNNVSF